MTSERFSSTGEKGHSEGNAEVESESEEVTVTPLKTQARRLVARLDNFHHVFDHVQDRFSVASAASRQVIFAFLLAPLMIPFAILLVVAEDNDGPVSVGRIVAALVIYGLFALPVAYVFEIILGIPAWLVFRYYGVRSRIAYAAGGALIGWLVSVLFALGPPRHLTLMDLFTPSINKSLRLCVIGAMASAVLFREIVFYRPKP